MFKQTLVIVLQLTSLGAMFNSGQSCCAVEVINLTISKNFLHLKSYIINIAYIRPRVDI